MRYLSLIIVLVFSSCAYHSKIRFSKVEPCLSDGSDELTLVSYLDSVKKETTFNENNRVKINVIDSKPTTKKKKTYTNLSINAYGYIKENERTSSFQNFKKVKEIVLQGIHTDSIIKHSPISYVHDLKSKKRISNGAFAVLITLAYTATFVGALLIAIAETEIFAALGIPILIILSLASFLQVHSNSGKESMRKHVVNSRWAIIITTILLGIGLIIGGIFMMLITDPFSFTFVFGLILALVVCVLLYLLVKNARRLANKPSNI